MPAPLIPRKWALRTQGRQVVFAKGVNESSEQVLMKALIWALYLPTYPDLTVEVSIGDRYKPDVISLDADGVPRFWGEAGQVGVEKIASLSRRYPHTHFALAKWDKRLEPVIEVVERAQRGLNRTAPFDLIRFPDDSAKRFIDLDNHLHVDFDALEWARLDDSGCSHLRKRSFDL